jgi:hypothetical protein
MEQAKNISGLHRDNRYEVFDTDDERAAAKYW